jgi:hypothetical protein
MDFMSQASTGDTIPPSPYTRPFFCPNHPASTPAIHQSIRCSKATGRRRCRNLVSMTDESAVALVTQAAVQEISSAKRCAPTWNVTREGAAAW